VEAYLAELGQDFVTDSTNLSDDYTRNRVRHEVVPVLRQLNPSVCGAAARLGGLLRQDEAYLHEQAAACLTRAARPDGAWETEPLREAHPAVRSRALRLLAEQSGIPMRDFTAQHVQALGQLLESADPSAECVLPHGFLARREYGAVRLEKPGTPVERPEIPLSVPFDGAVWQETVRLSLRGLEKNEVFYKSFNTFCADCGTIDFASLCVRTRRAGDRLRLTGNGGSRTLKKLMIDRRIPRARRDGLAVVADKYGVIAVQDIGMDHSRLPAGGARMQIKIEGY
ncbi:MAG: tRNA lysidine(34) synthetase TilS, partial [Agathobaculum sp.]